MNAARRVQRVPAHRRRQVRRHRLRHRLATRCTTSSSGWATSRCSTEHGNATFLRDVATPKDASFIQTNVVRVNGRRQVYIPVFRQLGSSTLDVVNDLQEALPDMQARLTSPDINLKVVMDQSVYVRHSIESLVQEGVLGAVLCSLVILLFLGEWRMTVIAVLTIPIAVLAALICLYYIGQHDQRDDAGRPVAGHRAAGR